MSAYTTSRNWLSLKHHTEPVYGFSCGDRDSDWDFADTPSRGYCFASEDTPIQLLNNSGGMDEDDVVVKDVWYPHQSATAPATQAAQQDSEMSDDQSSADDMDMDVDIQQPVQQQMQYQQTQPVNTTVNKRKRGADALEMSAGIATYEYQQMVFDPSKRVRVGA
jgi:hypothetical protein